MIFTYDPPLERVSSWERRETYRMDRVVVATVR